MKVSRIKIWAIFIWVLYVLILLVILEIFTRYIFHYHLDSFTLQKNAYFEMDKLKVWNEKFIEERKDSFKNWPIEIETFKATMSTPRYVFKPNLGVYIDDKNLVSKDFKNDSIRWSSNSLGFRSKEVKKNKRDNVIRIIALGASTTEGIKVSNNHTYPSILESILTGEGFDVEVINAGHSGYGIDDIIAFYNEKIIPLKPDIIIFYEVANNLVPTDWMPGWQWWNSWDTAYPTWFQFLHKHSAVIVTATKFFGIESKMPPTKKHAFSIDQPKPSVKYFHDKVKDLILSSKNNNIKIILSTFVTIAAENTQIKFGDNKELWKDLHFKWYPFTPGEIALIYQAYNNSIKDLAISENVPIIDLAAIYPKDQKYFIDHIHFKPEGNQILASLIADFLEKEVLNENRAFAN